MLLKRKTNSTRELYLVLPLDLPSGIVYIAYRQSYRERNSYPAQCSPMKGKCAHFSFYNFYLKNELKVSKPCLSTQE